jgi:hypothetical protein
MQALVGNILDRCITDAGYRGHNAPPDYKFKVYPAGQRRRGYAAHQARVQTARHQGRRQRCARCWTDIGALSKQIELALFYGQAPLRCNGLGCIEPACYPQTRGDELAIR